MDWRNAALLGVMLGSYTVLCPDCTWPASLPGGKDVLAYQSRSALAPASAGEGADAISLRQVLDMTLLRNPELAASALGIRAAEARRLQAGVLPNPEIELTMEDFGGTGAGKGLRSAETTLRLSQVIELGGKRTKRLRLAGLERDLAVWDYEAKRLEVLTDAAKAFVEVLVAQQRLDLLADLLRLSQQLLATVTARVQAGKVSPVEETKASIAAATTRLQFEQARSAQEAARQRLAAAWGSTAPTFERVQGALDVVGPVPTAAQLAGLVARNPDVARWTVEMAARQAAVANEQSKSLPDLTVSGGVRYVHDTDHTAFVAGVSLPLRLFDRNRGGILEARYRLAQAEQQGRAAEVRVRSALTEAYQTLASAYSAITVLQRDILPATQQALAAMTEGYRQGKFGLLDVLDAQRSLFETQGQYLDALALYHKAVVDVEHLIGEGLDAVGGDPGPLKKGE